jgi:hypothetical protein
MDGDMLRISKEKLTLYIGTTYGDDACQEWLLEMKLVLQEPTYPDAVLARHTIRSECKNHQDGHKPTEALHVI